MSDRPEPELFFSFFMFTADLRPEDAGYAQTIAGHMKALKDMGYAGFDLPIAPPPAGDYRGDLAHYRRLRERLERAGVGDAKVATNVGATRRFDPTSPYADQRRAALDYLKSRVDITEALGGTMLAGPIVFPYGVFPATDFGRPIWSDALQDWAEAGYARARPVLEELGAYAFGKNISLAIEPVDHWETPVPNMVAEVLAFLDGIESRQVGVCIDSAHVVLGSDGPEAFRQGVAHAADQGRLNYVHISAPDRGAIHESWIPWQAFLDPILPRFEGPFLLEIFNAVPVFLDGLRLTRRKFWIPDEDPPEPARPSAYDVAREALATVRANLNRFGVQAAPSPPSA